MALPEDEIAAAKRGLWIDDAAEFLRLHVGIAGGSVARGLERELHEPRTVGADRGAAAPKIGRADERLGHGDEIGFGRANRRRVARDDKAAAFEGEELAAPCAARRCPH